MNYLEYQEYINNCKNEVNIFLSGCLKKVDCEIKDAYTIQIFEGYAPWCYVAVDFCLNNFNVQLLVECDFKKDKIVVRSVRESDAFKNASEDFFCKKDDFEEKKLIKYMEDRKKQIDQVIERMKASLFY